MTSPHAGAPTSPVPTLGSDLSNVPTLRGFSACSITLSLYGMMHLVICWFMTTSVMMVTFNRLELTKRMFENFLKTTDSDYRLIVVDNGSVDGTVEWLRQLNPVGGHCQG